MRIEQGSRTISDLGFNKNLSRSILGSGDASYVYRGDIAGGDLGGLYPRPNVNWDSGMTTYDTRYTKAGTAPVNAGDAGTIGEFAYDNGNIYVCVATNTWKKVGIATW
jgi:hypothetical protein